MEEWWEKQTHFERCALYAVRLAMQRTWVTRRVETIRFADAYTVRRRMSIDLTLPESQSLDPGTSVYLPLMLFRKEALRNLDVRDAQDAAVAVLSSAQSGSVAIAGVAETLRRMAVGGLDRTAADAVDRDALGKIVFAKGGKGGSLTERDTAPDGALHAQLVHATPESRERVVSFVGELERSFMLLVEAEYEPGRRLLYKLAYDAALSPQHAAAGARAYTVANRILSSCGIGARVEFLDNLAVGLAGSYHVEVVAPDDTRIAETALEVQRGGGGPDDPPILDDHAFRPHIHATSRHRGDRGRLSLKVRVRRGELLIPLAFASLTISVVLGFIPTRAGHLDGQVVTALLLIPFALATFYIRSDENTYVTRMLLGMRLLAAVPLVAALWTIGLVALDLASCGSECPGRFPFTLATEVRLPFLLALPPTIVLLGAVVSPTIGRIARPLLRRYEQRARDATLAGRPAEAGPPRFVALRAIWIGFVAVLAILAAIGLVGYLGWEAATGWWNNVGAADD